MRRFENQRKDYLKTKLKIHMREHLEDYRDYEGALFIDFIPLVEDTAIFFNLIKTTEVPGQYTNNIRRPARYHYSTPKPLGNIYSATDIVWEAGREFLNEENLYDKVSDGKRIWPDYDNPSKKWRRF